MANNNYWHSNISYDTSILTRFYNMLFADKKSITFSTIDKDRKEELDAFVLPVMNNVTYSRQVKMALLLARDVDLGLQNADEKAYVYVNASDPDLVLLQLFKESENKEQLKEMCKRKFGIYDPYLLYLERSYDNFLKNLEQDEPEIKSGR